MVKLSANGMEYYGKGAAGNFYKLRDKLETLENRFRQIDQQALDCLAELREVEQSLKLNIGRQRQ